MAENTTRMSPVEQVAWELARVRRDFFLASQAEPFLHVNMGRDAYSVLATDPDVMRCLSYSVEAHQMFCRIDGVRVHAEPGLSVPKTAYSVYANGLIYDTFELTLPER